VFITFILNHSNPISSSIQATIFVNTLHTCLIPSLCVTYTILSKCYHTLFSSVLLHYSILMWIYPHESSLNSIFAYANHKIFITIMYLGESFFPVIELAIQTLNPYLVSQGSWHISLITKIIRNLKCWTNPFQLYALLDLVCLGPVCLWLWTSIAIDWKERTCLVERSDRVWTSKRQVTHMLLPTFTTALVFSVVCMIGGIFNCFKNA
jgi:hypothetical protein